MIEGQRTAQYYGQALRLGHRYLEPYSQDFIIFSELTNEPNRVFVLTSRSTESNGTNRKLRRKLSVVGTWLGAPGTVASIDEK